MITLVVRLYYVSIALPVTALLVVWFRARKRREEISDAPLTLGDVDRIIGSEARNAAIVGAYRSATTETMLVGAGVAAGGIASLLSLTM